MAIGEHWRNTRLEKTPWRKYDVAISSKTQTNWMWRSYACLRKRIYMCTERNMPSTPVDLSIGAVTFNGKAANAGGVAASGLEMSQNSMRISCDTRGGGRKTEPFMKNIHHLCWKRTGRWWNTICKSNEVAHQRANANISRGCLICAIIDLRYYRTNPEIPRKAFFTQTRFLLLCLSMNEFPVMLSSDKNPVFLRIYYTSGLRRKHFFRDEKTKNESWPVVTLWLDTKGVVSCIKSSYKLYSFFDFFKWEKGA